MKQIKEKNIYILVSIFAILLFLIVSFICTAEFYTENLQIEKDEPESETAENAKEHEGVDPMPKIKDIIIEDDRCTALCADGSVWEWEGIYEKKNLHKIPNLSFCIKILDAGSAMYALSLNGDVYAWGSNAGRQIDVEEDYRVIFYEPIKYLSGISDIEAKNGTQFAISQDGQFYMWGLDIGQPVDELKPGFPLEYMNLVEGVKHLSEGGWNHYYFIREDGTIFSIMEAMIYGGIHDFIFPVLEEEDESCLDWQNISYTDIRISSNGTNESIAILYELGKDNNVEKMGADAYTVFLYKKDGTLWYWDSNNIKFHDSRTLLAQYRGGECDYKGDFEKVEIQDVLEVGNSGESSEIVDICAGKENVLFLTDDGQVFMSEYVTSEIQSVEYYALTSDRPMWQLRQADRVPLKTIKFRKLEWENIISVNTNGEYQFSAVNDKGEYFYLNMTP